MLLGIGWWAWLLVGVFFFALAARIWFSIQRWRRRAAFGREMARRGLTRVDPEATEWRAFLAVARPGAEQGTRRTSHEDRGRLGASAETTITESKFAAEAFRFPGTPRRLIAVASWAEQRDLRSLHYRRRNEVIRQSFWVGELRELPLRGHVVAWSHPQAQFGPETREVAGSRGLGRDALEALPPDAPLSRSAREAMELGGAGAMLRASLSLAPTGWALESPTPRALTRLGDVLALVDAISDALDRQVG